MKSINDIIQWRSQEIFMGGARVKGLEGQGLQGPREGVREAKPPGRWRIFEKINENSNENSKKLSSII